MKDPYRGVIFMSNCNCSCLSLHNGYELHPGCKVRLHRFEGEIWTVEFGWFSFGGNRPMCGWYLSRDCGAVVKPLLLPDLDDIYVITN